MAEKPSTILDTTKDGSLVQVNMKEMSEQVADQVRAFLLNMMPTEALMPVIEQAFKRLTEPRPAVKDNYGRSNGPERPSELEEMVTSVMKTQMQAIVTEWADEWKTCAETQAAMESRFREYIDQAARTHIASIGESIFNRAMLAINSLPSVGSCSSCGRVVHQGQACSHCGTWN